MADWPDIAGKIVGNAHVLPVRVYYEDTDFSGIVYHGAYVRFCERGRSDYVRLMGISQKDFSESGEPAHFAVKRMNFDFIRPARFDDLLTVRTMTKERRGASLILDQEIWREDQKLVGAQVQVVLVSAAGKPLRLGKLF